MSFGASIPLISSASSSSWQPRGLFPVQESKRGAKGEHVQQYAFSFFVEATNSTNADPVTTQLLELAKELVPPAAFAHGQGQAWRHDETSYATLLEWREVTVPHTLAKLSEELSKLPDQDTQLPATLDKVLVTVICALARYVNIQPVATFKLGMLDEDVDSEGWLTPTTKSTADELIDRTQARLNTLQRREVAQTLLNSYIRPIFASSSSSASVSTGRRKVPVQGSSLLAPLDSQMGNHRVAFVDDDDEEAGSADAWKGAVSRYALLTQSSNDVLSKRNEALGCTNVLNWCIRTLRETTQSDSDWKSVWPSILPPLLTVLEDSEPRFRLKGVIMLHAHMLPRDGVGGVSGTLLVQTGIGVLFEQALRVNLTYLHDHKTGPCLLSESTGALRNLIMCTTDPITCTGTEGDGGRKRFDALCSLISQSVLSTWSYLSIPPSGTWPNRVLARVTCHWYCILAADLVPEDGGMSGVKRFLEVSLEWLFGAWMGTVSFLTRDEVDCTLIVTKTAHTILKLSHYDDTADDASANASITKLCGKTIFPGLCKCWISFCDSSFNDTQELKHELRSLTSLLAQMELSFSARLTELTKLDARISDLLTEEQP